MAVINKVAIVAIVSYLFVCSKAASPTTAEDVATVKYLCFKTLDYSAFMVVMNTWDCSRLVAVHSTMSDE